VRAAMRAKLDDGPSRAYYAQRSRTIEPVFGQVKTVQGARRFMRRDLSACQAEWKLLCGTHNLLKLWRLTTTTSRPGPDPGRHRQPRPWRGPGAVGRSLDPGRPRPAPSITRSETRHLCATGSNASKAHLYDVARRLGVPGRSSMRKRELVEAIDKANQARTRAARGRG
jgi:hypothetical protein